MTINILFYSIKLGGGGELGVSCWHRLHLFTQAFIKLLYSAFTVAGFINFALQLNYHKIYSLQSHGDPS